MIKIRFYTICRRCGYRKEPWMRTCPKCGGEMTLTKLQKHGYMILLLYVYIGRCHLVVVNGGFQCGW